MVNPDGSNPPQQITHGLNVSMAGYEESDCYLRWSPDGGYLVFTGQTVNSPNYTSFNVYEMTADGTQFWQQTSCQSTETYTNECGTPSWSPDGSKIAFWDANTFATDNLGGAGLYLLSLINNNTTPVPVYQQYNAFEEFPQWSSDGHKIIFLGENTYNSGNYNIWSINPDGTNPVPIILTNKTYGPTGAIDCSRCSRFDK
jgi:Tol biopolymer transport system component